MAGIRWVGVLLLAGAAAGLTGCFDPPPEAKERLASIQQQGREFDESLDAIEERLIGGQALMHQWQELGRRHKEVSAVTCQNLAEHVAGMEHHFEQQDEKAAKLRRGRMTATAEGNHTTVSAVPTKARKSRRAD